MAIHFTIRTWEGDSQTLIIHSLRNGHKAFNSLPKRNEETEPISASRRLATKACCLDGHRLPCLTKFYPTVTTLVLGCEQLNDSGTPTQTMFISSHFSLDSLLQLIPETCWNLELL